LNQLCASLMCAFGLLTGMNASASIAETFLKLSPSQFHFVKSLPLYRPAFQTYHPQGVKVFANSLYLTSVEGNSTGHGYLTQYQLDESSAVPIKQVRFDAVEWGHVLNHAGGMDGDEHTLYIPLAAYRPWGPARILKMNLADLSYTNLGVIGDHVGAIAYDPSRQLFRLFSWGSRGVYSTRMEPIRKTKIKSSSWEYQDCKTVALNEAICSAKKGLLFPVGELHLIRFNPNEGPAAFTILHRIRMPKLNPNGTYGGRRPVTYNAMDVQETAAGLRFYFVPHDQQQSSLLILDAKL
jgi:hypothetical protein